VALEFGFESGIKGGGRRAFKGPLNYTFGVHGLVVKRAAKATQLHSRVTLRDVDLERAFTMRITRRNVCSMLNTLELKQNFRVFGKSCGLLEEIERSCPHPILSTLF